jgi:BirA family biotin operon repressor/biotin-[acetyl-CoA-carboxylase] ligase
MGRVSPDLLRAVDLLAERGGALGRPLHILDETPSTNDEARHAARRGAPHGSTWVADVQTDGRGRQGRPWLSARGENLLFSVLWRQPCDPARLPLLCIAAGVAVCEALRRAASSEDILLKWPNDVVWVDRRSSASPAWRKLAGILVESTTARGETGHVVLGVGVNVHTRDFPEAIADRATSLSLIAPGPIDRAELLADLLVGLDRATTLVAARGLGLLRRELSEWDALRGRPVHSDAGSGVAVGIDDEGALVVERPDGKHTRWRSGDVHLGTAEVAARPP